MSAEPKPQVDTTRTIPFYKRTWPSLALFEVGAIMTLLGIAGLLTKSVFSSWMMPEALYGALGLAGTIVFVAVGAALCFAAYHLLRQAEFYLSRTAHSLDWEIDDHPAKDLYKGPYQNSRTFVLAAFGVMLFGTCAAMWAVHTGLELDACGWRRYFCQRGINVYYASFCLYPYATDSKHRHEGRVDVLKVMAGLPVQTTERF